MDSFEQILQRMEAEYEEKSGGKVEDVSEVGLRLRVLAGELHRLGASLDWLERQAFPQTGHRGPAGPARRPAGRGQAGGFPRHRDGVLLPVPAPLL